MKYNIGDIVKYENNKKIYVVLATKYDTLNKDYLKKITIPLNIKNIELISENNLKPISGFDYVINELKDIQDNIYILEGNFLSVFETNIYS
jgi:hypothetical protein